MRTRVGGQYAAHQWVRVQVPRRGRRRAQSRRPHGNPRGPGGPVLYAMAGPFVTGTVLHIDGGARLV
ncbi:hypothetical protein [Streptomyces sp. NBC_01443]|uniref:hypothetical protein n=1 Tax=Streptomyces sp. NBC_01443 TaxID=2903868 RepID=UPI00224F3EEB|nr:hypothetical protein [Streptomyces sp. NBC_01443]MCX4632232.1 hypothetical protein [Streptomyces sp. NBC_01443]